MWRDARRRPVKHRGGEVVGFHAVELPVNRHGDRLALWSSLWSDRAVHLRRRAAGEDEDGFGVRWLPRDRDLDEAIAAAEVCTVIRLGDHAAGEAREHAIGE